MFAGLFVLMVLVGFVALLIRVERIAGRLASLERQVQRSLGEQPLRTPSPQPSATPTPAPLPSESARTVAPALALPPRPPSRTKEEWEAVIGGKLLNRIGALALIIGVGLFLKYAFENNWVTEILRVLIGAVTGSATLLLAHRAHRKGFEIFAQGLVGAGIAILYLSVYASFNYYALVSQPVSFVLMSIVTAIGFWQAVRYDSRGITLLAWFGGFLTPVLLSTGEPNHIGLFSYLTILDAGIIALLAYRNRWAVLEALAIAGTSFLYFLWFTGNFSDYYLWSSAGFLLVFWVLFHGYDLFQVIRTAPPFPRARILVAAENAFLTSVAVLATFNRGDSEYLAEVLAILGVLYGVSAAVAARFRNDNRAAFLEYTLFAAALLAAAIAAEYDRFIPPILLTLEAMAVCWVGARAGYRTLVVVSEGLLLIALFMFMNVFGAFAFQPIGLYLPVWNERTVSLAFLGVGCAVNALIVRRSGMQGHADLLSYAWILILLIGVTVEINDMFRASSVDLDSLEAAAASYRRYLTVAASWSLIGIAFIVVARYRPSRPILLGGIWSLLIGTCIAAFHGIAFSPAELFVPLMNYRLGALFFIVGANGLALIYLCEMQNLPAWIGKFRTAFRVVVAGLLFVLVTGEIRDFVEHRLATLIDPPQDEITTLENLKQLGLSGGWLLYSVGLMVVGLWRRSRVLRIISIALFGFTILKIFIYDLSFLDTLYRFISFLALGAILLAVSYLYQRYRGVILGPSRN